jgi:hypothetical protein
MGNRKPKPKLKGLGDVVEKVTTAIGIEPCDGCEKRKEVLNKLFPFGVKELSDDQKQFLQELFKTEPKELSTQQQKEILGIYFDIYKVQPFEPCVGCSGVWRTILKRLKKLDYEN